MFNRILAPLDCSPLAECVLPHAIALARIFDAQVALLHVLAHTDSQARCGCVGVAAPPGRGRTLSVRRLHAPSGS